MHRLFQKSSFLSAQIFALRGTDRLLIWISWGFMTLLLSAILLFFSAAGMEAALLLTESRGPSPFLLWILPDFADAWLRLSSERLPEHLPFIPLLLAVIFGGLSSMVFFALAAASRQLARKANTASNSAAIRLEADASRDKAISEAAAMERLIQPPEATPSDALKNSRRGL